MRRGRILLQAPGSHVLKKIQEAPGTTITKTEEGVLEVYIPDAENAYFSSGHQVVVVLNHGTHERIPLPSGRVFAILTPKKKLLARNNAYCETCGTNSGVGISLREGENRYRITYQCANCGKSWQRRYRRK